MCPDGATNLYYHPLSLFKPFDPKDTPVSLLIYGYDYRDASGLSGGWHKKAQIAQNVEQENESRTERTTKHWLIDSHTPFSPGSRARSSRHSISFPFLDANSLSHDSLIHCSAHRVHVSLLICLRTGVRDKRVERDIV